MLNVNVVESDSSVEAGEVNAVAWRIDHGLGGSASGWIVWHASSVECCPTQRGWPSDRVPTVFEVGGGGPTGSVGDVVIDSHVQCGTCGSMLTPPFACLVTNESMIQSVAKNITTAYEASLAEATEELHIELVEMVDAALAELAEHIDNGGTFTDFDWPGSETNPEDPYVDQGQVVATRPTPGTTWDDDKPIVVSRLIPQALLP